LRTVRTSSLQDPISKIIRVKLTGGVVQAVEHQLCKHKFKSQSHKRKRKRETEKEREKET
jgi:hypothetical protein